MRRRPETLGHRYDDEALAVLAELVDDPSAWTHRVAETVETHDDAIRRSVSVTLTLPEVNSESLVLRAKRRVASAVGTELPDAPLRTFLVPLVFAQRGVLLDHFDVEDESGVKLPVLSQDENKTLARLLIEVGYQRALSGLALTNDEQKKVAVLRTFLASVPYLPPSESREVFSAVFGEAEVSTNRVYKRIRDDESLKRLVRFFTGSFLRVVEVRASEGDRIVLSYTYQSPWSAANRETRWDTWRAWIGQKPYSFRFPVPLAFRCSSYHFRMTAPDGSYCNRAEFVVPQSDTPSEVNTYEHWNPPPAVGVTQADPGLPYAHVYGHEIRGIPPSPLFVRVVFYERPPGSLGVAALFSLLATATIGASTLAYTHVVSHADLFALLLAIPAAAALWLGPLFDTNDLVQAPMSARMGVLAAGLLAYGAALHVVIAGAFGLDGALSWGLMAGVWWLPSFITFVYVSHRLATGIRHSAGVRRIVQPASVPDAS